MSSVLRGLRGMVSAVRFRRGKASAAFEFNVILEEDRVDGGFVAFCIEFPGCVSEGETEEAAIANIADAIAGVIAARMRQDLAVSLQSPPLPVEGEREHRRLKVAIGA
ncbi:MAG: type II toxin-antitoxin system HicB family antitoxin [Actinomycetota bacterium]|nr:type II toxin-antitoxin system HicB family antitoxin [Actinomycetota bacterium]